MTNGRLAELNGGYVLLYESDFGFCIRGRDVVMRPAMVGVSGVYLQRDHDGAAMAPGQSNAVHEGALAGHVRVHEARMMPEAYDLPKAQAAALGYGIDLVWPVLECTRIVKEQLAEIERRTNDAVGAPERLRAALKKPENVAKLAEMVEGMPLAKAMHDMGKAKPVKRKR